MPAYPVFVTAPAGIAYAAGGSNIFQVISDSSLTGTQAPTSANGSQTGYTAGTYSNLRVQVSANATAATACTVTSNLGGSAGGQTVSITLGTTGEFTDAIGTDAFSSGVFGVIIKNADVSNTCTITAISMLFNATTNTVKRIGCGTAAQAFSTASSTVYYPPFGLLASNATVGNVQAELYVTGTLKNLSVHLSANSRGTACTLKSNIGGSAGNLSASITANTTGEFHDTSSDSDSLANTGTIVCFQLTTGTAAGTVNLNTISADVVTTDQTSVVGLAVTGGSSIGASSTKYFTFAGTSQGDTSTETFQKIEIGAACVVSRITVNVTVNTASGGASTVHIRTGASGGSQSNGTGAASITASTTGFFSDSSGTDTLTAATEVNYSIVTASGGTITINSVACKLSQVPSAGGTNQLMLVGCGT